MKVVVTGSSGLVGRALIKRLVSAGHECVLLRRPAWDGEKDVAPANAFAGCEAVIHLAGENIAAKRWTSARKAHLLASRVETARNLALGLEQAGVKPRLFLSASAVGIFGSRGNELLTENSRPGDDFLAQLCVKWEAAADSIPADRIVKTRFGAILSPEGGFLEKVVPMFRKFGASRLGSGDQWFSWIHIHDAIEVIVRALVQPEFHGAINVVAPFPVTNSELTQELRRRLGVLPGPPAPAFALRLLYGQLSEALLGSQNARPQKLQQLGFKWKFETLGSALEEALQGGRF